MILLKTNTLASLKCLSRVFPRCFRTCC
jgi:hypothetical protein